MQMLLATLQAAAGSSSSSSATRLLCSLGSCLPQGLHTAAAPGSSIADAAASIPQPAAVQEVAQQQHQPHLKQQQRTARSLHQQLLYAMPPAGEPLPPLPRFRPRTPEQQPMPVLEALQFVQQTARSSHTVEAHVRLKVDPRRGDQMVRGAAVLPHSWQTGLRIAVFAEGAAAEEARAAGADVVGSAQLATSILDSKGKSIDFTACLATPDMMPHLVKLGRILGPKGLMPNPKMGTLTDNIVAAIAELRQGRVEFRMDRTGIVHAPIGKASFDPQALYLNMGALTGALLAVKPEAIKGGLVKFVRSVYLASTMGPSVPVDVGTLADAVSAAAAAVQAKQQKSA